MSLHDPPFLDAYRAEVKRRGGNVVCLLDEARLVSVLQYNRRAGIPCLLAPHNIQSFHDVLWPNASAWRNRVRAGNFRHEFQCLMLAQRSLCISKVEAGMVAGIGLPAAYYPYRATGEIARYCDEIRALRAGRANGGSTGAKVTFLFVGSAGHPPTVASVNWLLEHVTRAPLPDEMELVLAGTGTDRLADGRKLPANVSALGRVSNDHLKELLVRARAVLVPAFSGMGAVTRLAELHRAGLPLLVSSHAMRAIDPLPGVITLNESWPEWVAAMRALAAAAPPVEIVADDEQRQLDRLRGWVNEAAESRPDLA